MSRRIEDFDPSCDPDNPKPIKIEEVTEAYNSIKKYIVRTPCAAAHFQKNFAMHLHYKLENLQESGSFKERGIVYAIQKLPLDKRKIGIALATLGNAGTSAAYTCSKLKIPVYLVMPTSVPIARLQRCFMLGAKVVVQGFNLIEAQRYARAIARDKGLTYINGRDHPHMLAGYGSLALEILEDVPNVDAIILPVGTGGLAAAVATVVKNKKPDCLIYGVQPETTPLFFKILEKDSKEVAVINRATIADNLNVSFVGTNSFGNVQYAINKMVLVPENLIARAMLHMYDRECLVIEGAGACPLAAIMGKLVPELKLKTVVAILTGGNVDPSVFSRCLQRGLSASGHLVKFKVRIKDNALAQTQVLRLIEGLGYTMVDEFQIHRWLDEDEYKMEDINEPCDPANPRKISYNDVLEAAKNIQPHIIRTQCVAAYAHKFTMNLYFKLENTQHSGCFKERGIMNVLQNLSPEKRKLGVVLASLGNSADAAAHIGSKLSIPVYVVMPTTVTIARRQRCRVMGAKSVIMQGANLLEARRYARALAKDKGLLYIDSRDHPDVLAGYGSIAIEILDDIPNVDAVIVPVGTGGLVSAIATVVKTRKPKCLVYGVQPEAVPLFFKLITDEKAETPTENEPTIADNLSTLMVGVNSFYSVKSLLDRMLLVKEEWIARAMLHMYDRERMVVEGAGACPLAAIMGSLVPELKTKNVVTILTGGNTDVTAYSRCLERGMSAEGQLVKFRVGIKDNSTAQVDLMRLLEKGGYTLIHEFQTHRWLDHEEYKLEVCLCARCRNLEHALELKRFIERAYPCAVTFENEPYTDKRTCPCFAYKNLTCKDDQAWAKTF